MGLGVVAEARHARALLPQAVEIEVGGDESRLLREADGLGEAFAVFVDQCVAVPGEVGRGFTRARRGVEASGDALRRMRRAEQAAIVGLADGHVARREVRQYRCARERGERARRQRHPEVFAHLEVQHEAGQVARGEQQARAEGHVLAEQPQRGRDRLGGRGELPALVEFAVVRQVALRHGAEQPASMHQHGAVEQAVVGPERQPDGDRKRQVAARLDQRAECRERGVEQRILLEQVLVGIGREAEFGKHGEHGALAGCLPREAHGLRQVDARGGHLDAWRGDRDPGEPVPVDRLERRLRGGAGLGHAGP